MENLASETDSTTELLEKNSTKMPIQTPNLDNQAFCNLSEPPCYSRQGLAHYVRLLLNYFADFPLPFSTQQL